MAKKIKRMNIQEFRHLGFLQEANRLFFHPLGLALEVIITDEEESLGGIWDFRNDPEGILFKQGMIEEEKIKRVEDLRKSKVKLRSNYDHCNKEGIQHR